MEVDEDMLTKVSTSTAECSKPVVDRRTRLRHNLLIIEYDKNKPLLRVVKRCRSHLATMGVPEANGQHSLYPEEAVFLVETCLALITYPNGRQLTLLECYRILEQQSIPFYKYSIYYQLKKAGLVIVRPICRNSSSFDVSSSFLQEKPKENHEKSTFLQCFPTVDHGRLHMVPLHLKRQFVPLQLTIPLVPHRSVLQFTQNSKRNKVCRPKSLLQKNLSSASSWSTYRNMRRNAPYLRTTRQPTEVTSLVDYEVYLVNQYSYHTSTLFKPLFNLVCHDTSQGSIDVEKLSSANIANVIVAVHNQEKVNLVSLSGESISLNDVVNKAQNG